MKKKQLIIIAICLGVILLGIGFAAFSSNLRVKTNATVRADESNFSVVFSSKADSLSTAAVAASPSNLGSNATIVNGDTPTISGLNAKFTEPNQTVTYTFYARNEGQYDAYLNEIIVNNITGESTNKKCTPGTGTDATLVSGACNGISMKIKVGTLEETSVSNQNITGHMLGKGQSETIVVTITYASNSVRADGPFSVSFGDIGLVYNSVDNEETTSIQNYKPQYYSFDLSGTVGTTAAPASPSNVPPTGKDYYLGYDVTNGKVSTAYVCFKRNGTEYCLKGYDSNAYNTNKAILEEAYKDVEGACDFDDDGSNCRAGGLYANANSNGNVNAHDVDAGCYVYGLGSFECSEY